jgi:hypothetical protein
MHPGCLQRRINTVAFMNVSASANIGPTMTFSIDKRYKLFAYPNPHLHEQKLLPHSVIPSLVPPMQFSSSPPVSPSPSKIQTTSPIQKSSKLSVLCS